MEKIHPPKKPQPNLIFGRHPVVDALQSGTPMDKLLLQQGTRGEFEKEIRHLARQFNVPLQVIPKERMNKWTRKNHQGIIGLLSLLTYYRIEDVLPTIYEQSKTPLLVIMDGVTDVRNFGAIARSAEVSGAQAIIIPKKGSAQINADAIKTSAGALTKIAVCREHSLIRTIEFLQMSGIQVLASDLKGSKKVFDLDLSLPTALVVGAEGDGVSKAVLQQVDERFIIPQPGTTDSLNVSVATGIMLYEAVRQRYAT
ncbi:MAG: 23S rRNA (guanosine(2251)-2'-O)-methyltransferase RlmB [Bacteroidota bacterium]